MIRDVHLSKQAKPGSIDFVSMEEVHKHEY